MGVIAHRPSTPVIYGTQPTADAHDLRVSGPLYSARLSVYELASEQAAATYASHCSGGDYINPQAGQAIMVDYAAPPHFYRDHELIAVYVGTDPQALSLLSSVLGSPFTEVHF